MLGADTARRELSSCCLSVSPAQLVFGTAHAGESISLWLVGLVSLGSSRSIPKRLRSLRGEMGSVGTATAGRHPEPDLVFSLFFHPVSLRNPGINATFCGKKGRTSRKQGREAESRLCFRLETCPRSRMFSITQAGLCGITWAGSSGEKRYPTGRPFSNTPFPKIQQQPGF